MKRFATISLLSVFVILLAASTQTALSQLLSITEKKMFVQGQPSSYLEPYAEVRNSTAADVTVRIQRTSLNMPADWFVSFCLVNCYSPEATDVTDILPAGETYNFKPTIETSATPGQGTVTYVLSPVANPAEKYTLTFSVSTITDAPDAAVLPRTLTLSQNYPNPFTGTGYAVTTIGYGVPRNSFVTIKVYNLVGREVRTLVSEVKQAGTHAAIWDGRDNDGNSMQSGIYIYKISNGTSSLSRRMLLSR